MKSVINGYGTLTVLPKTAKIPTTKNRAFIIRIMSTQAVINISAVVGSHVSVIEYNIIKTVANGRCTNKRMQKL